MFVSFVQLHACSEVCVDVGVGLDPHPVSTGSDVDCAETMRLRARIHAAEHDYVVRLCRGINRTVAAPKKLFLRCLHPYLRGAPWTLLERHH